MKGIRSSYIALILAIAVVLSSFPFFVISASAGGGVWNGTASSGFASGNGTKESPYLVDTAEQLAYLSNAVKSGNTFEGKYIELSSDIYLNNVVGNSWTSSARQWTPIGINGYEIAPFKGNFNGKTYAIYGLYINVNADNQGLFGYCEGADISNVTINRSSVSNRGNSVTENVAGIVAYIENGRITNCVNNAEVSGRSHVGGIVGYARNTTVSNCENAGLISGKGDVGGVAGYAKGDVIGCVNNGEVKGDTNDIGGVVGTLGTGRTISECINDATVSYGDSLGGVVGTLLGENTVIYCENYGSITGSDDVGGIVGQGSNNDKSTVIYSYNLGNVICNNSNGGGIVGSAYASTEIVSCENYGEICGVRGSVGGIVGAAGTLTYRCLNGGAVYIQDSTGNLYNVGGIAAELPRYAVVEECLSAAEIYGDKRVGGIVGIAKGDSTIINCYAISVVVGVESVGGIVGDLDNDAKVMNCISISLVGGETSVGAVIGSLYTRAGAGNKVSNCYYLLGSAVTSDEKYQNGIGDYDGSTPQADIAGKTDGLYEEEFAYKANFPTLDFKNVWGIVEGVPILQIFHNHENFKSEHDSSNHWLECDCGFKNEVEPHTESEWVIVTEPEDYKPGLREKHCTVCNGLIKSEIIPQLKSVKGDVNGNGKIDAQDYSLAKRHCLKTYTLSSDMIARGDLNGNGNIDASEYALIKRHCLGTFVIK